MHFRLLLYFRKKEREKARESALQDLTKLGNLGALTGLEIIEGEEEDEADVFEESYDKTDLEDTRRNSTTIRLETEQNALIKSMYDFRELIRALAQVGSRRCFKKMLILK